MRSRWSEEEALGFVARYGAQWGEPLALRTYSSRLLGADPELVRAYVARKQVSLPSSCRESRYQFLLVRQGSADRPA